MVYVTQVCRQLPSRIRILLGSCQQTCMYCCVYSEKLLMMDRETVRNMYSFILKINFEKLVHPVGFIIRIW